MYWFWGMNMFWWIFWLLLVFGVIFAWQRPRTGIRRDAAVDVLREKYAAGEVSDEEYQHRLDVLTARERTVPRDKQPPTHTGSPAAA
jgi:putative membrane protein